MPKVMLTSEDRAAARNAYRHKSFIRALAERKLNGITQNRIAADIGVTCSTISDWKRDSGSMSLRALRRMADTAGLTDDEILSIVRGRRN